MTDEAPAPIEEPRDFTYQHPGTLPLDPANVGYVAAGHLRHAAETSMAHAQATVRQVRSSYLSQQLEDEPTATPQDLAAAWKRSAEKRRCESVLLAVRAYRQRANDLAALLEVRQTRRENEEPA